MTHFPDKSYDALLHERAEIEKQISDAFRRRREIETELLTRTKWGGSASKIIAHVAAEHGFTMAQMLGTRRHPDIVAARHEAMLRVHEALKDMSLPQIGRAFGRDHTSVINGIRRAKERRKAAA